MKKNVFLLGMCLFAQFSVAQIIIKNTDMPAPRDTFRIDATTSIPPIDLNDTGPNHIWDFSNLFTVYTRTDTFIHPNQTPIYYWINFNMFNTTVATKIQTPVDFGNIQASDVYNYYNTTSSRYEQVGTAATINGIPLTAKNDANDVIYRFPLAYNDIDSCFSNFEFKIPNILYIKRDLFRKNYVDGWGKISSPYGSFDCLRMKSEVNQTDSVYVDTLGQGMKFNRKYVEFRWIAKNEGIPLAYVQALVNLGGQLQIQFVEFKNKNTVNRDDLFQSQVQTFPHPAKDFIFIRGYLENSEELYMQWFDLQGKLISEQKLPASIGVNEWRLEKPQIGLSVLKIAGKNGIWSQKIVWE